MENIYFEYKKKDNVEFYTLVIYVSISLELEATGQGFNVVMLL